MILKLFSKLENPEHRLLGPNLWALTCCGMWFTNPVQRIISIIAHSFNVILQLSQFYEIWIWRSDVEKVIKGLSFTCLCSICAVKGITFIIWGKKLKTIVNYISNLENNQPLQENNDCKKVINKYTKYSRILTYTYWLLISSTEFTVILSPLIMFLISSEEEKTLMRNGTLPYPTIFMSWVPFDKSNGLGFWMHITSQVIVIIIGGTIAMCYDTTVFVIMAFIKGQLKILLLNSSKVFGDDNENLTDNEAMIRIVQCHQHHGILIKCSEILNYMVSPVMFINVVLYSLTICGSAIQVVSGTTTPAIRVWIADYVLCQIIQLFAYCWHSNEILWMSQKVHRGVFESKWWARSAKMQKLALILHKQLFREIKFTAGPFSNMSVTTFISILKASYSYYAILSNTVN